MIRKFLLAFSIMFLTTVNAFAYSGDCVIWGQPNGQYLPTPYPGDSTGFGRARDACIRKGGGVITIGPGCESVVTTYPNGANILVVKYFGSGWIADPFSLSATTFANLRIARLGPTSGAGTGGAVRIIEGSTFSQTGAGVQAAHDDLPATGGLIIVTGGTYNYTSTINITKSNVTIQGMGGSASKFVNSHATGVDAFLVTGGNCTITGIEIDGQNGTKIEGEGIRVENGGFQIHQNRIVNMPDYGIHIHTGSSSGSVTNNIIGNIGDAGSLKGSGVVVHDSPNVRVIGNNITNTLHYGVYIQGTTTKAVVEGNTISDSQTDGILADSTAKYIAIVGNNVQDSKINGITANSDSSLVSDNLIARSGKDASPLGFGLWAVARANGSSWWGNHVIDSEDYGIAWHPENLVTSTAAGLSIFSNFIANNNGFGIHLLANSNSGLSDVMIGNNYIIGTGQTQSGIHIQTSAGSHGMNRIHILGNVVKNSVDDGIEITGGGTNGIKDLFITENHILNNADAGLIFQGDGTNSTAFISDNVLKGNGTNTPVLGVNWKVESFADREVRGSKAFFHQDSWFGSSVNVSDTLNVSGMAIVDDSLRVDGTANFHGTSSVIGNFTVTGSLTQGSVGALTKEGTSGNITLPTGGNRVNFSFAGDNFVGPTVAGGALVLTSNGGANRTVELPGTGREALVNGKAVIIDSLRVMMPLKLGQTSGIPQYHVMGDGGGNQADTLTLAMNGTTNSANRSPKIMLLRSGAPIGMFAAHNGGLDLRWPQNTNPGLWLGALGTNTPTYRFDLTSATTGSMAVNKSTAADATLEVNGNAQVNDSIHVFESPEFGVRDNSLAADTLRVGRTMAIKKYGSTADAIFHNTGNILEMTNDGNNILRASDAAGFWSFQTGGTTTRLTIPADGGITLQSVLHANLPSSGNGTLMYCSDCNKVAPCTSGGTGAVAKREAGAWNCD